MRPKGTIWARRLAVLGALGALGYVASFEIELRLSRSRAAACLREAEGPRGPELPSCSGLVRGFDRPSTKSWTRTDATYQAEELLARVAMNEYRDAAIGAPSSERLSLAVAEVARHEAIVKAGSRRINLEDLGDSVMAPDVGKLASSLGDRIALLENFKDLELWYLQKDALEAALVEADFELATELAETLKDSELGSGDLSTTVGARKLIDMDPNIPAAIKQQYLVSIAEDGSLVAGKLPSVLEVDYVTRALNDVAQAGDGKGALGRGTNEGRIYGNLSRELRTATKAAVPEYWTALEAAGTEIGIQKAREVGATFLQQATTRRDVAEAMAGMPQAEVLAVKAAVREHIDDTIANVRRTMSRPGTDAGEAVKALKDLSSRAAQTKLGYILGDKEAAKLADRLDEASTAFEIGAALQQNSKTAVRQSVQGSIEQSTAPGGKSANV